MCVTGRSRQGGGARKENLLELIEVTRKLLRILQYTVDVDVPYLVNIFIAYALGSKDKAIKHNAY